MLHDARAQADAKVSEMTAALQQVENVAAQRIEYLERIATAQAEELEHAKATHDQIVTTAELQKKGTT